MKKDYYSTSDFQIAIIALYFGQQLQDIAFIDNSSRATFYFYLTSDLIKVIDAYWQDSLQVNPQKFMNTYKMLKNRLNNVKQHMVWSDKAIQDLIARVKVEEGREITYEEAEAMADEIFYWVKLLVLKNNVNDYDKRNDKLKNNN